MNIKYGDKRNVCIECVNIFAVLLIITINQLISSFKNASPVMHPRIKLKKISEFTDRYLMAGNVHKMKVGFTRNATR